MSVVLASVVILSGLALAVEKSLVVTLNSFIFNIFPIVFAHLGIVALTGPPRRLPPAEIDSIGTSTQ
jgi:hypothetical protein